jgi:hypothetical protein
MPEKKWRIDTENFQAAAAPGGQLPRSAEGRIEGSQRKAPFSASGGDAPPPSSTRSSLLEPVSDAATPRPGQLTISTDRKKQVAWKSPLAKSMLTTPSLVA